MEDRISELPIPILHHILCFLSQKEAVKTCVLSKQWRHIGSTRPNLEFFEEWFNCSIIQHALSLLSRLWSNLDSTQQNFDSIVDRTLQGYLDQNLSIHQLHLHLSTPVSEPVISLINNWIPMIPDLNIKVFKLIFLSPTFDLSLTPPYYESLEELHLRNCKLSLVESVRFDRLCILTLEHVQVDDGTFETIMLGCPSLMCLVLYFCGGLRNVRLRSHGLKHFELLDSKRIEGRSIEINAPSIETVFISAPWIWRHRQSALMFSRLRTLSLYSVILSSKTFDLLSCCLTLEFLILHNCSGFDEFHLASDSVIFLSIWTTKILLKGVTICAPNIVHFEFTAHISQAPDTFSFTTTTSKEWSSKVFFYSHKDDPDLDLNSWFLKLRRVLKALSGSWISLFLQMDCGPLDVPCSAVQGDEQPVVVWELIFATRKSPTTSWYNGFTNGLFRICRPSLVSCCRFVSESDKSYRLSEFQFNILLAMKSLRTEPCFWQHDLEQVFVECLDGRQRQLMQWTTLGELRNRAQDENIRLGLKWICDQNV
ncbi:Unknown protein [Striga hermonthica]|uniref:F-box domain-containing protein n=1 Tax=Striga hermonthica TaxID=68872 RepID=A0A9N7RL36_STRHE|nr:Unknown protein [Striga hermonthica]